MDPKILVRRQEELRRKRPAYMKARECLDNQRELIEDILNMVSKYKPGDNAEKAIYIISQLHLTLKPIKQAVSIVRDYESAERSYNKLRNSLPKETSEGIQKPE